MQKVFDVLVLVAWVFIGATNLLSSQGISKWDYSLVWILLILHLIIKLL